MTAQQKTDAARALAASKAQQARAKQENAVKTELLEALIYLRDCIETGKEPGMGIVHAAIKKAGG